MEKKLETYIFTVNCQNCETEVVMEIPKETTVDTWAKQTKCPNCGCFLKCQSNCYWNTTTIC